MHAHQHDIISAGCSEAARMKSAVADAAADASVTMNAGQFATLARLVENLCEIALGSVSGDMGDPRYWVPLEEYAKLKREKEKLAAQCVSFDLRLAGGDLPSPSWHDTIAMRSSDAIAAPRPLL